MMNLQGTSSEGGGERVCVDVEKETKRESDSNSEQSEDELE